MADVKKRAEARRRRQLLVRYGGLVLLFVVAAATVFGFYEVHAVSGRLILLILMPAVFYELLFLFKWRVEEYSERLDVPDRIFRVEGRAHILRRIRRTKWQMGLYAATVIGGFIYAFLWRSAPDLGKVDYIVGGLLGLLFAHFWGLKDRLIQLQADLITADNDLKKFDAFFEKLFNIKDEEPGGPEKE